MALSDDQRAMLRLLAQREQGYGDLAALMGLSVDEVRTRVKEALDQLEADGEAAPPVEPAPSETVAPEPPAPPPAEPASPAPAPAAQARPAEPAAPASPAATPPATAGAARRPKPSLPSGRGPRLAIAAGVLAVVALVVVLLVSGGDSGDDSSGSGDSGSTAALNANSGNGQEVTQAVLDAVDGSDAQGVAVFGRVKDSLALQVEATGLEPTAAGDSYTIWLYESGEKMLPLASAAVDKTGRLGAQVAVPTEVLGYLANETFDQIDISRTTDATLKASLAKATREKEAPIYTGTDVLRGEITGPIIGAAKK